MNVRLLALATALGLVLSLMGSTAADAAPKKRPDLVVGSLSVAPANTGPGQPIRIKDVTRNRGRTVARPSVTRYVLSKDKKVDRRDVRLHDRRVKRLKPGKKHATKVVKVRVPRNVKPGTYWLIACADARRKVRESNERNNCRVARQRLTIAGASRQWPDSGYVKVDISAGVDIAYRHRSASTGFATVNDEDVRLTGTGSGWLQFAGGKPTSLVWVWSKANATGTRLYDAEGQTNTDCRWDAYAKFTRSAALDVVPGGVPAGGMIDFPGSLYGPRAHFGIEHDFGRQATPRIDCEGKNIGDEKPQLQLRQYWWSRDPRYTINWSGASSKITWRQYGETHYVSPSGESTEDQSYQADGVLTVTPAK